MASKSRENKQAHLTRMIVEAMIAQHMIVRSSQGIKFCYDLVQGFLCLVFWVEAIQNVPKVDAELHLRFFPPCHCSSQTLQTCSVVSWHSIEREAIGYVGILYIADKPCVTMLLDLVRWLTKAKKRKLSCWQVRKIWKNATHCIASLQKEFWSASTRQC